MIMSGQKMKTKTILGKLGDLVTLVMEIKRRRK